jgi:hypothetical protein
LDSFIDRIVQCKALSTLYKKNLDANRQMTYDAAVAANKKRVKLNEGENVTHTEIVEWLGVNADLLQDGTRDQFSNSAITVGVLVRISNLVTDRNLRFFQGIIANNKDKNGRRRYMVSCNNGTCEMRASGLAETRLDQIGRSRGTGGVSLPTRYGPQSRNKSGPSLQLVSTSPLSGKSCDWDVSPS